MANIVPLNRFPYKKRAFRRSYPINNAGNMLGIKFTT